MSAPLFSTITLVAELVVSAAVFYTFYTAYKYKKFPKFVALGAIIYETAFDITYMVHRVPAQESTLDKPIVKILGAFHGILSLLMFIGLIVFFASAYIGYLKGINYFRVHKNLTFVFLIFWTISVLSGICLYFAAYYL